MIKNDSFVAYEYKDASVKRDYAAMYIDCLGNFGWALVEDDSFGFQAKLSNLNPVNLGMNIANAAQAFAATPDGAEMVTLKFKRDRRIENKVKLDKLERAYEEALMAISTVEKKNSAYAMGMSLGIGIIGTSFLALGVSNFMSANMVPAVILAIIGFAGWGIGFFSHRRMGKNKSAQTELQIQKYLDAVYSACEQAHALLA